MKNLRLGQITVIFMGLLLIISGCGVTVKMDDPAGAARAARDAAQRDKLEETTTPEPETTDVREFSEIIPPFPETDKVRYDDKIGYEEWFHFVDEETVQPIDGVIRRQFYRVPEGRSALEIVRYYQSKIQEIDGEIFFISRNPLELEFDGHDIVHYFNQQRESRGISTYVFDHTDMPPRMTEFLSAKINIDGNDVYIVVAVGNPRYNSLRYEVVTVVDKPMTW